MTWIVFVHGFNGIEYLSILIYNGNITSGFEVPDTILTL